MAKKHDDKFIISLVVIVAVVGVVALVGLFLGMGMQSRDIAGKAGEGLLGQDSGAETGVGGEAPVGEACNKYYQKIDCECEQNIIIKMEFAKTNLTQLMVADIKQKYTGIMDHPDYPWCYILSWEYNYNPTAEALGVEVPSVGKLTLSCDSGVKKNFDPGNKYCGDCDLSNKNSICQNHWQYTAPQGMCNQFTDAEHTKRQKEMDKSSSLFHKISENYANNTATGEIYFRPYASGDCVDTDECCDPTPPSTTVDEGLGSDSPGGTGLEDGSTSTGSTEPGSEEVDYEYSFDCGCEKAVEITVYCQEVISMAKVNEVLSPQGLVATEGSATFPAFKYSSEAGLLVSRIIVSSLYPEAKFSPKFCPGSNCEASGRGCKETSEGDINCYPSDADSAQMQSIADDIAAKCPGGGTAEVTWSIPAMTIYTPCRSTGRIC